MSETKPQMTTVIIGYCLRILNLTLIVYYATDLSESNQNVQRLLSLKGRPLDVLQFIPVYVVCI